MKSFGVFILLRKLEKQQFGPHYHGRNQEIATSPIPFSFLAAGKMKEEARTKRRQAVVEKKGRGVLETCS